MGLQCSFVQHSLIMLSQAKPRRPPVALHSKFAEQTRGAAEGSVSVAASLGSNSAL